MTDTANLGLPCIEGSQAQKHVTHNEALRILDTLVQLAVLDRDLTAPPGSPAEGQRWIVKAGATGAWAGHDDAIAAWQDEAWRFCAPQTGWLAYAIDEGALLAWNGAAWASAVEALTPTALNNMTLLGVGATADATNPFSAKLNNVLFTARTAAEGGDGDLRYKMSKEAAANTLSLLFQDNFSGRAEIGLAGDDDFHFKVSPDGTTWHDGIVIDKDTGAVSFPNSSIVGSGGGRELLGADRTFYVRTDGSDGNDGLTNTSAGAFLTINHAIAVAAALDLSVHDVTIQVGAGTYGENVVLKSSVGAGRIKIVGDTSTPSNVIVATTNHGFYGESILGAYEIHGFKVTGTGTRNGITAIGKTTNIVFGNMVFDTDGFHVNAQVGATISFDAAYEITRGAGAHWYSQGGNIRKAANVTITLTGTPAFSSAFAYATRASLQEINGQTFSGSATGARYYADLNSLLFVGGGGANYLPGSSAGSTSNGGIYQ